LYYILPEHLFIVKRLIEILIIFGKVVKGSKGGQNGHHQECQIECPAQGGEYETVPLHLPAPGEVKA
jgi:hypothetical protein